LRQSETGSAPPISLGRGLEMLAFLENWQSWSEQGWDFPAKVAA
jgi:hypothetical protein